MAAKEFKLTWDTEINPSTKIETVKFDLYMLPFDIMPKLIKQLNNALFIHSCSADFRDERALNASRAGRSIEGQMALDLKLKNS